MNREFEDWFAEFNLLEETTDVRAEGLENLGNGELAERRIVVLED
jgi:hypothetical protein